MSIGRKLLACVVVVAMATGLYLAGYARLLSPPHFLRGPVDRTSTALYQSRVDYFRRFPAQADLVFVGDSLIEYGEWGEHFPDHSVANRGIGGDHTVGLGRRLDALGDLGQSTVVLTIGINDFLGLQSEPAEVAIRYEAILRELMSRARTVVLQSTIPVTAPADTRANGPIAELNARMEAACRDNCTYLDLAVLRGNDGSLRGDVTIDGIHLNGAGYLAWAEALRGHLATWHGGAGPVD